MGFVDAKQRYLKNSVVNKMTPEEATKSIEISNDIASTGAAPLTASVYGYDNYKKNKVLNYSQQYPEMAPLIADPALGSLTTQSIDDVAMNAKASRDYKELVTSIKEQDSGVGGTIADSYERRNLQQRRDKAFVNSYSDELDEDQKQVHRDIVKLIDKRLQFIPNPDKDSLIFNTAQSIGDLGATMDRSLLVGGALSVTPVGPVAGLIGTGLVITDEANYRFAARYLMEHPEATALEALEAVESGATVEAGIEIGMTAVGGNVLGRLLKPIKNITAKGATAKALSKTKLGRAINDSFLGRFFKSGVIGGTGELLEEIPQGQSEEAMFASIGTDKSHFETAMEYIGADTRNVVDNLTKGTPLNERNEGIKEMFRKTFGATFLLGGIGGGADYVTEKKSNYSTEKSKSRVQKSNENQVFQKSLDNIKQTIDSSKAPDVFKQKMMEELSKNNSTYLTVSNLNDLDIMAQEKLSADKYDRFSEIRAKVESEYDLQQKIDSGEKINVPIADFVEAFGLDNELFQSAKEMASPTDITDSAVEMQGKDSRAYEISSDVEAYGEIIDSVLDMEQFTNLKNNEKASIAGAMQVQFDSLRKALKDGQDLTVQSFKENYLPGYARDFRANKKGAFDRVNKLVRVFDKGDITSVMHENQHWWSTTIEEAYYKDELNPEYRKIYEDVRKHLGENKKSKAISTEGQEKLAEEFEKYMATGKAPNASLGRLFRDIKQMMLAVYGTLRTIGDGKKLSPELTEYFDAMYAADLQVTVAENRTGLNPIAKPEWMNDEEYVKYKQTVENAREEEALLTRKANEKRAKKKETKASQEFLEKQKQGFIDKMQDEPVYIAQGELLQDKISKEYADEFFITAPMYVTKDGKYGKSMDIDALATSLGYKTGLDMISEALAIPTLEQQSEIFANKELENKINRESDVELSDVPYLSQQNKLRLKQLVTESGVKNVNAVMKDTIDSVNRAMAEMSVQDATDYQTTYDTFVKQNNEMRDNFTKGNDAVAQSLAKKAAYNSVMLEAKRDASNTMDQLSNKVDFINNANKSAIKSIGQKNYDLILDMLNNWKLTTNSSTSAMNLDEQVDAWVARQPKGMFFDSKIVGENKEFIVGGSSKQYKDTQKQIENMNYKEAEFLSILSDGIEQTSRVAESTLLQNKDKVAKLENTELMEHFLKQDGVIKKVTKVDGKGRFEKWSNKIRKAFHGLDAQETWLVKMFGEKVAQTVIRPFFRAMERSTISYEKTVTKIGDIYVKNGFDRGGLTATKDNYIEELGISISNQTKLEIALNNGNVHNKSNMRTTLEQEVRQTDGRTISLNDAMYDGILNRIELKFFKLARDISAVISEDKNLVAKQYKKHTGNDFVEVLGDEFTVHGKTFKGWYYPSEKIDLDKVSAMEEEFGSDVFIKNIKNQNFNTERTMNKLGGLDLTNGHLMRHLRNKAMFLEAADEYNSVREFLVNNRRDIRRIAGDYRYDMINNWTKQVFKPDIITNVFVAQADKVIKMAILGAKATTSLLQLTAFVNAAPEVGMNNVRKALGKKFTELGSWSPNSMRNKSVGLRNRYDNGQQAVLNIMKDYHKTKVSGYDKTMGWMFLPLQYFDLIAADIAYDAAHIKATEELGYNAEEASIYADSIMRTTQGDFSAYSKPEIAKGWARLMVPFGTYFLASSSNLRASFAVGDVTKGTSYLIALGLVIPIMETFIRETADELIKGEDDDDEVTFAVKAIENSIQTLTLAMFPVTGLGIDKLPMNAFKTIIPVIDPDIKVSRKYYSSGIPLTQAVAKASMGLDNTSKGILAAAGFKTKKDAKEYLAKGADQIGSLFLPNDLWKILSDRMFEKYLDK